MTTPITLHPDTVEFAELLAVEFNMRHSDASEPRAWFFSKWDCIATGEVTPTFGFEHGVGIEAAAVYVDGDLRRSFAGEPTDLTIVLAWLGEWLSDRRGART